MKTVKLFLIFTLLIGLTILASCTPGSPDNTEPKLEMTLKTDVPLVVPEETEIVIETTEVVMDTETPIVERETMIGEEIIHQSQPGNPTYSKSLTEECNTGFAITQPGYKIKPPCDNWGINLLERAVSADVEEFYHYIDILSAKAGKDSDWFYLSFDLFGAGLPGDGNDLTYFFELDFNQDGRGDILLTAKNLEIFATEWTVAGVQALRDMNGDVGGATPIRPDNTTGDGYETVLFDAGTGDDPDLVWVRHNPDRVQQIEFAVKSNVMEGKTSFMWWAGAMIGDFAPSAFDFVDSQDSSEFYAIDTTCGMILGRETAYNIRKCYIPPTPTQSKFRSVPTEFVCIQPPKPTPDSCWIWFPNECEWVCFN